MAGSRFRASMENFSCLRTPCKHRQTENIGNGIYCPPVPPADHPTNPYPVPTLLTHPAVPLALACALADAPVSRRLLLAGIAASILPDLDTLAFRFGIAYGAQLGHRGFSHSLLFALLVALLGMLAANWLKASRQRCFAFLFLACASHGILDAFTNGGLGVALLWPYSEHRYFAPFRPIEVSPFGLQRFLARAPTLLASEIRWVWLPLTGLAVLTLAGRWRFRARGKVAGVLP